MPTRPVGAPAHRPDSSTTPHDSEFFALVGRLLWRWRLEAVLIVVLALPLAWLAFRFGWVTASVLLVPGPGVNCCCGVPVAVYVPSSALPS